MSGEIVQLTAWLSNYQRNQYTEIYERMKDKHISAMALLFQNHEKSAEEHYKQLEIEYSTAFDWENTNPGDVFQMIHEKAYEFYEFEVLMEHNYHLSFLANMYQIFEQQLRSFAYSELNHRLSPVRTKKLARFGTNMNEIKEAYKAMGYDLEKNMYWETIRTLSDIVNTFKHGVGRSAKRLLKKHPEIFKIDTYNNQRVMDRELTTNFVVVFDIKKIDFNVYANVLINFWEDFPEYLEGTYRFEE
ncbi:hypothetical protein ACQCWD_20725 [Bacillus thuringiensis]|uniref:Uncharacterized protein n=1 Tax=Bacillus cereus TaxID=1396 RepID=A0AAN6B5Y0_BACCE|nr:MULTISPECIES: hypothetical protein [Bacillus cereus group]KAB2364184.1 hypothetical protein F8517_26075 [Bacillus thuringiensis]KAB2447026.1 hypothetical protein F8165_26010 [Bacillus cereus]KAB2486410.1 hypothetical protein F8157_13030 [Bacillus cereus]